MMKINFINITDNLIGYRSQIDIFVKQLNSEKELFNLTAERVMKSELALVAMDSKEIIGIAGLERKHSIVRAYFLLRRDYQGKGIGKLYMQELLSQAKKTHSLIMSVVEEKNISSMRVNLAVGYRIAGKRANLYYIFNPLNTKCRLKIKLT